MLKSSEDGGIIGGLLFSFFTLLMENLLGMEESLFHHLQTFWWYFWMERPTSLYRWDIASFYFSNTRNTLWWMGEGRIQRDREESELNIKLKYGAIWNLIRCKWNVLLGNYPELSETFEVVEGRGMFDEHCSYMTLNYFGVRIFEGECWIMAEKLFWDVWEFWILEGEC